jgi:hypothetical protein
MRALSIRQPWAELILRGVKTIEYRSRPTRVVGERFWIYASRQSAVGIRQCKGKGGVWSRDLAGPGEGPPAWMWALAEQLILRGEPLPTGVIVGSAVIDRVAPGDGGGFRWHLIDVERAAAVRRPTRHPQPAWFRPF